jgi:hypothetical protein
MSRNPGGRLTGPVVDHVGVVQVITASRGGQEAGGAADAGEVEAGQVQAGGGGVDVRVDERGRDEGAVEPDLAGAGVQGAGRASCPTQTPVPPVTAIAVASGPAGV